MIIKDIEAAQDQAEIEAVKLSQLDKNKRRGNKNKTVHRMKQSSRNDIAMRCRRGAARG